MNDTQRHLQDAIASAASFLKIATAADPDRIEEVIVLLNQELTAARAAVGNAAASRRSRLTVVS